MVDRQPPVSRRFRRRGLIAALLGAAAMAVALPAGVLAGGGGTDSARSTEQAPSVLDAQQGNRDRRDGQRDHNCPGHDRRGGNEEQGSAPSGPDSSSQL
jgi:hypothetical protein